MIHPLLSHYHKASFEKCVDRIESWVRFILCRTYLVEIGQIYPDDDSRTGHICVDEKDVIKSLPSEVISPEKVQAMVERMVEMRLKQL